MPPVITSDAPRPPAAAPTTTPHVWGLDAVALHDAYWRARGIQCVRRGERDDLPRAADGYLLIDPGQLVLFDLTPLVERLVWHHARLTRVRLTDEHADPYLERIVTDADGLVQRIERRYRPSFYAAYRVMLTPSRAIARRWMTAPTRRDARLAVRNAVTWAEVDFWHCPGVVHDAKVGTACASFIDRLVETWRTPNQSIAGIEEVERGVWRELGSEALPGVVRVPPLWLGNHVADDDGCHIGPAWLADEGSPDGGPVAHSVFVRDIADVTPAETRISVTPGGHVASDRAHRTYQFRKRLFDVIVSAGLLVALAPLLLVLCLALWIDDGRPFFFGHVRQTRGGRLFRCWKFRTMRRDAEHLVASLQEQNSCDGPQVFIKDDPRVTRVGKILRKTNLDELPQLWNVLIGHMSLVGPRPSPDGENQFCPAWRELRLSVRPGIAGLWQLRRRREPGEDFQEWIKYDIEYVRRASMWFDLRIMVRTARMLAFGRSDHASEYAE